MAIGLLGQSYAKISQGIESEQQQNGNYAITISKRFLEEQQNVMKKSFIVEAKDMKMKDVKVMQKNEAVRLTSIMQDMQLASINLDDSRFMIDLLPNQDADLTQSCLRDFQISLKLNGAQASISFNQFMENESSSIEEDWGVGQFDLLDIDFEILMQPYISNNNNLVRLNILEDKLTFGDYKYVLRTREDSQFDNMLGKFSSVFSEHLRK